VPIELKFRGGLELAEIVSRLGSNLETIKKRLTRAKSRLADCIEFKLGMSEGQP
jgi:DNA-directed RNA polymerase specialized sigma24 family protein